MAPTPLLLLALLGLLPASLPGDADSRDRTAANPERNAGTPIPEAESFPVGERLVYTGQVNKAGVSVEVGTAVFTVDRNERGATVITASARGEKFGYTLDTRLTSELSADLFRPVFHEYTQRGSEICDKRLIFTDDGAIYWKVKHCREEDCTDSAHMMKKTNWVAGVIPAGSREAHCDRRRCRIPEHQLWKVRTRHTFEKAHYDLLSAVYHARNLDLRPGAKPTVIPVITDRDRWRITIRATSMGKCEVKAGTFDAMQLILEPEPEEEGTKPGRFEGLFGMHGTIHIWVDARTHVPLLVKGTLPFGFMDLHARVELAEIGRVETAGSPSATTGK